MKLTELPSDIRVLILSHLDFPSLSHLVRTHSSFNSVWKSYPEHLSRAICIRNGLADSKTLSAAAPLQAEGWHKRGGLEKEPSEEELKDVIREQRSMTGAFDGIKSWREYAHRRWKIDQNWKNGRFRTELLHLDVSRHGPPNTGEFWRFKLDPVSRWIVVTGLIGGLKAFDSEGKLVWKSNIPAEPYGHLESTYSNSDSYLCTAHAANIFLIWRFHDPTRSQDPPPILNLPAPVLESIKPHVRSFDLNQRGYHPYTALAGPSAFRASKLRYPYLIASTRNHDSLFKFNFTEQGTVRSTVSLTAAMNGQGVGMEEDGEQEVGYLELDDESYFVAGLRSVQIYRPQRSSDNGGSSVVHRKCWPPETPPGYRYLQPLIPHPLYRENGRSLRPWTAVHHDSKSRFIVGASTMVLHADSIGEMEHAVLSITYRYKAAIFNESARPHHDREEVEQKTMNLRIDGVTEISQLSVENDRAIFVASSLIGHALFLLPLRPFETLSEFVANPPEPICLSFPLPCISAPARIESTSTEIFVPICTGLVEDSTMHQYLNEAFNNQKRYAKRLDKKFPFPLQWQTLDGQTLVNYENECLAVRGPAWEKLEELQIETEEEGAKLGIEETRGICSFSRFSFSVDS
ncbi:hypothetical protein JCM3765_001370 [Sporobolomyces pararoseus]